MRILPVAAMFALAAWPVWADPAGSVRTGDAAFGDWRGDAPGVGRLITPDSLPLPFASSSQARSPSVIDRPAGAAPRVPPGFEATLFASGLEMPRTMRTAPNGDVFVAESSGGRVSVLRRAERPVAFASGLDMPFGIAFWPPGPSPSFVYVAETGRVVRYAYQAGDLKARSAPEIVVPKLPEGGSHWTRDIVFSADGQKLFVSVGSFDNIARDLTGMPPPNMPFGSAWKDNTNRAVLLQLDPDGGNPRTFATGLRNCSAEAIQPATGALWCAVNERDGLGDNLPPDYVTRVQLGAFYGWPWFYIGNHRDPRLGGARADLAEHVTTPDVLLQPHSAPLGLAFYDNAGFPTEYRGDAFVALHGSWNRAKRTGYKVVRLRFKDGRSTGVYEDFVTGFVASDDTVWARPVGVTVMRDGALLVSEDGNGTIWRIAWRGP